MADDRELAAVENPHPLPRRLDGHWVSPGGAEMALAYVDKSRSDLCHGEVSDFALANRVFMASRDDLDLIVWQTAAKERIRWLSAQLAALTRPPADPDNEGLAGVAEVERVIRVAMQDEFLAGRSWEGDRVRRRADRAAVAAQDILAALATAPRATEADTARAEEREACAKVADGFDDTATDNPYSEAARVIAAAIRNRTLSDGASNVDRG